jgi:hypothetical protein
MAKMDMGAVCADVAGMPPYRHRSPAFNLASGSEPVI